MGVLIKKYWYLIAIVIVLLIMKKKGGFSPGTEEKTLYLGDRGDDVKDLQTWINKNLSSEPIDIDGDYGDITATALRVILEFNAKLDENHIKIDDDKVVQVDKLWALKIGNQ